MKGDGWTEPGRSVAEDGRAIYAWPPEGRFAALWDRCDSSFSDAEKEELLSLLMRWGSENSTDVACKDMGGEWVDVEPDWSVVSSWLREEHQP